MEESELIQAHSCATDTILDRSSRSYQPCAPIKPPSNERETHTTHYIDPIKFPSWTSSSFLFLIISKYSKKSTANLPPGPWKFPIIGNLHLLYGSTPPHQTLANLATKYGPLMHLQLGEVGAVIVSSPEMAKEFLKTNDTVFASRPSFLAPEINCFGSTDIAFSPYGDYWRQLRSICTLHLLTAKRVESFRPIRMEEVVQQCGNLAKEEGSVINLTEVSEPRILLLWLGLLTGRREGGEASKLNSIMKEAEELVSVFNVVDVYPSYRFLRLFSGIKKKIEEHHKELNLITDSIIEERKRAHAAKGNEERDLLDVLLNLQGEVSLRIPLTTNNIKSVLLDGAGMESSTTITGWAMAEMLNNPRVLKKAQDEVRSVFDGTENRVNEIYFHELNYLKLVTKETLRLHPPVPLLLPRESMADCEIDRYRIPSKTWVLINAWAIGRDPKHWEDAYSFKPERFLGKPVDFKANTTFEYISFGGGRRICPGVLFGIANIEIQMAMLLYHFDWIQPNGMKPDLEESPAGMTGKMKCDLHLIPIVKRPLMYS